jgi:drug/metabolite transporter superfamily protein YnfA
MLNGAILLVGSVCTHTYFSFVLAYTQNIWASAIAHIAFNNISGAFAFYAVVQNQTLANLGIVIVMLLLTFFGWVSGLYPKTFRAFSRLSVEK